jgi:hypothetical protein
VVVLAQRMGCYLRNSGVTLGPTEENVSLVDKHTCKPEERMHSGHVVPRKGGPKTAEGCTADPSKGGLGPF